MKVKPICIHLYHKLPTPYNDYLFRELGKQKDIDLQVYHLWSHRVNRPWKLKLANGYNNHYLNTKYLGIDWKLLKVAFNDRDSFFMVGDWAHASSISILLLRIFLKAPVSIWADTPQENLPRPWYKRIPRKAFLSWLLPKMDFVFGTGEPGTRTLKSMGTPLDRVVNLPCYVDLSIPTLFSEEERCIELSAEFREKVRCKNNGVVFLMSGMCTYKKGHDIGIKAFALSIKTIPTRMGLLIAGTGPERAKLEKLVDEYGISDRVSFLNWLEPDDMNAAYLACDVFLHCARWDPFPLVILEAMSWGKAVVGSNACGSVQDRIKYGENGFSFQSGNVDELSALIEKLTNDSRLRYELGKAARKTAEGWPVEKGVATIVNAARKALSCC